MSGEPSLVVSPTNPPPSNSAGSSRPAARNPAAPGQGAVAVSMKHCGMTDPAPLAMTPGIDWPIFPFGGDMRVRNGEQVAAWLETAAG